MKQLPWQRKYKAFALLAAAFQLFCALISLADMAEISEESKVVVPEYQPNFTPLTSAP